MDMHCFYSGCSLSAIKMGFCGEHFVLWRAHVALSRYGRDNSERFWRQVDKSGDCWLWTSRLDRHGYGRFSDGQHQVLAHRRAYELVIGPIPAGLVIDHLCRVRSCVNPVHLEPVSNQENIRRGVASGTAHGRPRRGGMCRHGHPMTEENTGHRNTGYDYCKACNRRRSQEWKARRLLRASAE